MNIIIEILIIVIFGIAAAGFLIWYFYSSSKKRKCSSCSFNSSDIKKNKNTAGPVNQSNSRYEKEGPNDGNIEKKN